jgi:hypothetical protein
VKPPSILPSSSQAATRSVNSASVRALGFGLTQPSRNFRNGSFGVREVAGEPLVGTLLEPFLHIGGNRVVRVVDLIVQPAILAQRRALEDCMNCTPEFCCPLKDWEFFDFFAMPICLARSCRQQEFPITIRDSD